MLQTRNVYILLFALNWAQGVPVGFMTHALPVILRAQGVSLAQIGGVSMPVVKRLSSFSKLP